MGGMSRTGSSMYQMWGEAIDYRNGRGGRWSNDVYQIAGDYIYVPRLTRVLLLSQTDLPLDSLPAALPHKDNPDHSNLVSGSSRDLENLEIQKMWQ